jgi:hypothetical protein
LVNRRKQRYRIANTNPCKTVDYNQHRERHVRDVLFLRVDLEQLVSVGQKANKLIRHEVWLVTAIVMFAVLRETQEDCVQRHLVEIETNVGDEVSKQANHKHHDRPVVNIVTALQFK